MKLHLVSLGCAKNLVDSELMLGRLMRAGGTVTPDPGNADIIIINTCSFIESAINESIDTILELARHKQTGVCQRLIVAGCLPERFRDKIVESLPEVDFFLGTGAFNEIVTAVKGSLGPAPCFLPAPDSSLLQEHAATRVLSSSHMAYLKIAEGCSRHCTYCIIPKLRGKQKSRCLDDIVAEARSLISSGVKELVLVAQDTTNYGKDLRSPVSFSRVLEEIAEISENTWVRFLYGHPESLEDSVIRTVAAQHNICSYFDIPIQHVSDRILKKMGRNYDADDLNRLFDKIRLMVPDAALRTTVIAGFPEETDQDFQTLLNFITSIRFDHLGVFIYSDSEDLPSHRLSNHVPQREAKDRYDHLMSRQLDISLENNRKHMGKVYDVLVEGATDDGAAVGRTFFQAPEVDGVTYIRSKGLQIGSFVSVRIVDSFEYDLKGDVV
jgi:ribosomal protein S12 methylthiotransferase